MQKSRTITLVHDNDFLSYVQSYTGENITSCYQCGKCSAGCPTAYAMDITPRQVMRGIQLGLKNEILRSRAIWLCISCQTCSVRCPREIDIARIMECLRLIAQDEGRAPAQKDIDTFYRSFLQQVRMFGRVYEVGLGMTYNLRSMHLFNNLSRLPVLFIKGKLKLMPQRTGGSSDVKRLAKRVKKIESELR